MTPFSVYLVVRNTPDGNKSHVLDRRLRALRALHGELSALGIHVTATPDRADLEVEITNVFVAGETHAPAHADSARVVERGRIISIRLSVADEHVELVCSDGMGRVPAEQHAAQRILMWLDLSSRPRMSELVHAPTA